MIFSSTDIYRLLVADPVVSAIASIKIASGRPVIEASDGVLIYIDEYPELEEFEAEWKLWIIDFDGEPLDILFQRLSKLLPRFEIDDDGPIIEAKTTELRSDKTQRRPETTTAPSNSVDLPDFSDWEDRFESLRESIEDRMLLVNSGRPGKNGRDGRDGKDGKDGRDGIDQLATDAKLNDLKDVYVDDPKKEQFLGFNGEAWVAMYVPQVFSGGGSILPPGGSNNAVLAKKSDRDWHVGWTNSPVFESISFELEPTVTPPVGGLVWNPDEGTLDLYKLNGVVNQIGQELQLQCRNSTATTIANGTAVMYVGSLGNSGRLLVAPMVANGTFPGYVFFGVATQDIAPGSDGYITVFGEVRGVDTRVWPDNTILWCDPAVPGGFTAIEPQAPNLKLPVAAVVNSARNGILMVRWDTGRRLQDLHDVEANGSTADGEILTWVEANDRWEAAPIDGGTY